MVSALECSNSLIVNLEGLNELVPQIRDPMTQMMKSTIQTFIRQIGNDQNVKVVLLKSGRYPVKLGIGTLLLSIKEENMIREGGHTPTLVLHLYPTGHGVLGDLLPSVPRKKSHQFFFNESILFLAMYRLCVTKPR